MVHEGGQAWLRESDGHPGACYEDGNAVEKNAGTAVKWCTKAAELGDSDAMNNLGECYVNGDGVDKNAETAIKWYTKAAELGNTNAMVNLGACCANGDGVEKSVETAVKWFTKAAELGDSTAMFNLGLCYKIGDGVEKSDETAVKWFTQAAELGDSQAMFNLGACYVNGVGVEKNAEAGAQWFAKAAAAGNVEAMFLLGLCCETGEGAVHNRDVAIAWFTTASSLGHVGATAALAERFADAPARPPAPPVCGQCGVGALNHCGGCYSVMYCSAACASGRTGSSTSRRAANQQAEQPTFLGDKKKAKRCFDLSDLSVDEEHGSIQVSSVDADGSGVVDVDVVDARRECKGRLPVRAEPDRVHAHLAGVVCVWRGKGQRRLLLRRLLHVGVARRRRRARGAALRTGESVRRCA